MRRRRNETGRSSANQGPSPVLQLQTRGSLTLTEEKAKQSEGRNPRDATQGPRPLDPRGFPLLAELRGREGGRYAVAYPSQVPRSSPHAGPSPAREPPSSRQATARAQPGTLCFCSASGGPAARGSFTQRRARGKAARFPAVRPSPPGAARGLAESSVRRGRGTRKDRRAIRARC